MTIKKKKKESWYRLVFNFLMGEKFMGHVLYLGFGMIVGSIGFTSMQIWSQIDDIVQFQMFSMLTLIYIVLYVYLAVKHIKGFLPMIVYFSVALIAYGVDNIIMYSYYVLVGLYIFALVDDFVTHLQRRKT